MARLNEALLRTKRANGSESRDRINRLRLGRSSQGAIQVVPFEVSSHTARRIFRIRLTGHFPRRSADDS